MAVEIINGWTVLLSHVCFSAFVPALYLRSGSGQEDVYEGAGGEAEGLSNAAGRLSCPAAGLLCPESCAQWPFQSPGLIH